MILVKMVKTGEMKEVTRNVAFGLIDRHEAILVTSGVSKGYENRMLKVKSKRLPK